VEFVENLLLKFASWNDDIVFVVLVYSLSEISLILVYGEF
jgi:hypothetical protein